MPRAASWKKLDNAALIFPSASNDANTYVFRVSCQLFEMVDASVLSNAVQAALMSFPVFRSVLKRGFFWYYLEESELVPIVEEEKTPPCSPLLMRERKTLLFRVSYYKKRVNLEMYHVLSDGTGAMEFLKLIIHHYLTEKHKGVEFPIPHYDASAVERETDSFFKYYSGKQKNKGKPPRILAYRFKGAKNVENRLSVIEGVMPIKDVLSVSHNHHASLTVYLTAALILAIYQDMPLRARKRPIVVTIPVNLRQFFPSSSARNFFSIIRVKFDIPSHEPTLLEIMEQVKKSFDEELTTEKMEARLNSLYAIERNVAARAAPLILKDFVLSIAYRRSARENTANLSNVGKVVLPEMYSEYIERFDVFTSTTKIQICLCSYGDVLTISFSSEFVSTEVQKNFFRILSGEGIDVEISASRPAE